MTKLFTFVAVGAAVAFAGAAMAQSPSISLPFEKFTLDNGLTVVVHEDRKAPVVAVSIWYDVGSRDEPAGKTGFAHLFEHLMFNGSENYDQDWFKPFEDVGATDLNGTTWLDRTNYFQTVPTPALDMALWMESDRMGHLLGAVTQDKLDEQRGVVQNEKRQGDNQPYGRLRYNLYEGLFPVGHPYHHSTIGSMEDLDAASLETVQQWFKDFYGPNNAVLVLAGDIDATTARGLVETYFGDIPAGPEIERETSLIPARPHNTAEIMYDKVPAARLNRVYVAPGRGDRESALLTLAGVVLGSGKTSRLYTDIVYEGQTATDASANLSPFQLASVFNVDVLMKPGESPEAAGVRVDAVLAEFLRTGPTAEELERAKTRINAQTIRGLERVGGFGGKAVTLAEGELYHGDPAFNLKRLEWINTATVADVTAAARRWLSNGYHQVITLPNPTLAHAETGVDRSTGLPGIGDMPSLVFPPIVEDRLRNGVRVVLAERSTIPVVQVVASFDAGFAADSISGKPGLADIALDMLDEGAGKLDALEIAAEAESLGAILSAGSGLDTSTVSLNALKSNLSASLDLWASLILEPTFADADIERLRATLIADIGQEKANPGALGRRLLPPLMFGEGHAYAAPLTGSGTTESVASITRADIVDFHKTWLRPSNMTIFVVGDATMAEIKPLLERTIGRMPEPAGALPTKNVAPVALGTAPRMILVDKPGSPQSFILAGHVSPSTTDANIVALDAANEAIGGSFSARVNMNLREDKGWSYGARTFPLDAVGQRPWLINAPVQTDKTGDSIREILAELEGYRGDKPVTAEELDRLVKNNTRSLPGQYETAGAVMGEILTNARFGRPLNYATQLNALYEGLTVEAVSAAARDLIQPQSLIWVVVGDRAKVEPQLQGLGFSEIEFMDVDGNLIE